MSEYEAGRETLYVDGAVECPACGWSTTDPLDWSEMGLRNEDGYEMEAKCRQCEARFKVTILLSYTFACRLATQPTTPAETP